MEPRKVHSAILILCTYNTGVITEWYSTRWSMHYTSHAFFAPLVDLCNSHAFLSWLKFYPSGHSFYKSIVERVRVTSVILRMTRHLRLLLSHSTRLKTKNPKERNLVFFCLFVYQLATSVVSQIFESKQKAKTPPYCISLFFQTYSCQQQNNR